MPRWAECSPVGVVFFEVWGLVFEVWVLIDSLSLAGLLTRTKNEVSLARMTWLG